MYVKASVVKVTPPCQKMAGVECGCGLGSGPRKNSCFSEIKGI